ncbi:hypothetical protein [Adhaeribacter soli]|uniref:hypothetical protein n=1 Tax=Adhaeribacter soli TaxID=2607655 RepID=UPI00177C1D33|nr:hypothetical protein [Adhaeribacter soli]
MKRFAKTVFCLFLLGTIPAQTQTTTKKGQVRKVTPKPAKSKQQVVKKGIKKIGPSTPISVISEKTNKE